MSAIKGRNGTSRAAAARALILGASLSGIAVAGSIDMSVAQSDAERACAAVMNLKSRFTVERVLREFADNDCIPIMLAALPEDLLARINPDLVAALPANQLRKVPRDVLEIIGVDPNRPNTTTTTQRNNAPNTYRPPRNNNSRQY